jgi:PKD repeat protein
MGKRKIIILFSLVLVLSIIQISTLFAAASTVAFNPTDDSYVSTTNPDQNNNNLNLMSIRNIGLGGGWMCAGVIKFDTSSIPTNAEIVSATLNLFYFKWQDNDPVGRSLSLRCFEGNWNEATITNNNMPSYNSQVTATCIVPSAPGVWLTADVTGDVQKFVAGTISNYGWIITDDQYWGGSDIPSIYCYQKEWGSDKPILGITYTIPTVPNQDPVAGFSRSPLNPTTDDTIQFTDTSYDTAGTITAWSWNFGDNSISTSRNPTHRYTQSGLYTVTLQVTDNNGATNLMSASIPISKSTPGFDFIIAVCAIAFVLFLKLKRKKLI